MDFNLLMEDLIHNFLNYKPNALSTRPSKTGTGVSWPDRSCEYDPPPVNSNLLINYFFKIYKMFLNITYNNNNFFK